MAYTRKTWECGDVVTAEALNNLEGGVEEALECCGSGGSEPLVVTVSYDETAQKYVSSHTYAEIAEAKANGRLVMVTLADNTEFAASTDNDILGAFFSYVEPNIYREENVYTSVLMAYDYYADKLIIGSAIWKSDNEFLITYPTSYIQATASA